MKLDELKRKAELNDVPIMQEDGILFCQKFIQEHQVRSVLEIGTAIGYWSLCMAALDEKLVIDTVELEEERYLEAVSHVQAFGKEKQIKLYHQDAGCFEPKRHYDLIFLDGPKGQHASYFKRFLPYLKDKGTVIVDNMAFHGYMDHKEEFRHRKNLWKMLSKIERFKTSVKSNPDLITMEIETGDGLLLIWRKYPQEC